MRLSVCVDMMFSHLPFTERFAAVKNCGINTVEFWKWSNKDLDAVTEETERLDMGISIFNIDSSDSALSDDLSEGILNAGRQKEFLGAIEESIPVYKRLKADGMIVLVGRDNGMPEQEQAKQTCRCLKAARELVEKENITLVIEPLNTFDRKGYAMPYADQVLSVLREVGSPNIKMLYDIYHQNMMGDFSMEVIRDNIDMIGHFHVADCPGRHEPGTGKVDYPRILGEIERLPYSGCVGLEYRATKADDETFGFLKEVPHV